MKLIILASGKAERLFDIHQGCYPKILMNLGNSILLEEMVNSFPEAKEVHIILNSELQISQVKEIINAKNLKQEFSFWQADVETGIADKLYILSKEEGFPTEDVMISWSDIHPVKKIQNITENTIFSDNDLRHRMTFVNNEIFHCQNADGNLCGLFFIKDLKSIFENIHVTGTQLDFADVLSRKIDNGLNFDQQYIDLVDTGDMQKYVALLNDVDIRARFFNSIEIDDEIVTKKALTEDGKRVLKNEVEFYQKIRKFDNISMPKLIISTTSEMKIERIHGRTINEWINQCDRGYKSSYFGQDLYEQFCGAIESLHEISHPVFLPEEQIQSVHKEYLQVTAERFEKCKSILPSISSVNGIEVNRHDVFEYISEQFRRMKDDILSGKMSFKFIHGDPNTSNVMYSINKEIFFIDPRGSFGNHKYYGDPAYDHAKFLYGLTGYDSFNLTKNVRFDYNKVTQSISYDCVKGYDLDSLTDDKNLKFLVGLIWLKLPYYTINNINKAIVAYAHGLKLLTQSMNS